MPKSRSDKIEQDLPQYLRLIAEKFDTDADAQIAAFLTNMESIAQPVRLFHYTNDDGAQNIIVSGKLWLSDIFTLNDTSEIVYALQAALRFARAQINSEEMRILSDQLDHFTTIDAAKSIANYFVCSFSSNGDDIGQWRSYADNGSGFALEFDTAELEANFTRLNGIPIVNNSTFPVNYKEEVLKILVEKLVSLFAQKIAFVRKVKPAAKEEYAAYMSDLLLTMALHLYRLSLFFKHPAYWQEGEYRFLSLFSITDTVPDVKLRLRKNIEVRYREFDWRTLAPKSLKGVRIGPAANVEAARVLVTESLTRAGITDVVISTSSIPFRA